MRPNSRNCKTLETVKWAIRVGRWKFSLRREFGSFGAAEYHFKMPKLVDKHLLRELHRPGWAAFWLFLLYGVVAHVLFGAIYWAVIDAQFAVLVPLVLLQAFAALAVAPAMSSFNLASPTGPNGHAEAPAPSR